MKLLRLTGCTALLLAMLSPQLSHSQNCTTRCRNSKEYPFCVQAGYDCHCECVRIDDKQAPKEMLTNFIQERESVDKSKIDNLDKVIQKAVKESSQKVDTPVKFMVKVQSGENTPPKEVKYQIKTSR